MNVEDEDLDDMNFQRKTVYNPNDRALNVLLPQEINEDDNNSLSSKENIISVDPKKAKKDDNADDNQNINVDLTQLPFKNNQDDIIMAISGKTFEMLYNMNQKYESENIEDKAASIRNTQKEMPPSKLALKPFHDAFRLILRHCSVYARCSPDNKTQLVQSLQKEGFHVLMCGDGANDCGALKAADVGVSLSQEEASIAAPFTSTNPDISCIIDVLNQGKCALVTSVEIFKYMIAFSITEFAAMTIMMFCNTFLFDFESIVIDAFITLPFCTFLPMTQAYETFNYHMPNSNLVSFPIIISLFFQVLFNILFQIGGVILVNHFFPKDLYTEVNNCREDDGSNTKSSCLENSIIFYVSFFQFLFVGLVLITSKPFKKEIYTNIPFFIFLILCIIYIFYIMFYNDYFSKEKIKILYFPDDDFIDHYNDKNATYYKEVNPKIGMPFKYYLMIYCIINFLICFFLEKKFVAYLIKRWSNKQFKKNQAIIRKKDIEPTLDLINSVKNYVRENEKSKKKYNLKKPIINN